MNNRTPLAYNAAQWFCQFMRHDCHEPLPLLKKATQFLDEPLLPALFDAPHCTFPPGLKTFVSAEEKGTREKDLDLT